MEETFEIKIIHRYKINRVGYEVIACGMISFAVLSFFRMPYAWMGVDMAPIELNIATLISIIIILYGCLLNGIRRNEKAILVLNASEIIIKNKRILKKLKYDKIERFEGQGLGVKNVSFKIITKNEDDIEITANKEIYEWLIEYFPEKEQH